MLFIFLARVGDFHPAGPYPNTFPNLVGQSLPLLNVTCPKISNNYSQQSLQATFYQKVHQIRYYFLLIIFLKCSKGTTQIGLKNQRIAINFRVNLGILVLSNDDS